MSNETRQYLIVGPAWVGDMVMAQSLFIDLRRRYPDCRIDVLAPAWTAALVDRMPEVNRLISSDFQHGKLGLRARFRLAKTLRNNGYTHAIILPNSYKAALIPWRAKIPRRTGFVGEQRWGVVNDIRRLDKAALPMTVQRFLALGSPATEPCRELNEVPTPELVVKPDQVNALLGDKGLNSDSRILVLCPGAEFGPSKQWPLQHYAEVANYFLDQGWQVWVMGSDKDKPVGEAINHLTQAHCHILAGDTTLPQAVDLLSCANLVVSNDSGLMHIAAALSRPLVAVYGSTDPGHTPPLSSNHRIARLDLDCSPCFQRQCPLQHLDCLQKLSAQTVIEQAKKALP